MKGECCGPRHGRKGHGHHGHGRKGRGCGCGNHHGFRKFKTKEEIREQLEAYKEELEKEIQAVEEKLEELQ
ncbi:MAG: hypothetical protein ACOCTN_01275 [Candidatus Natronoplasma sp.]